MKLKFIAIIALCSITFASFAGLVQMPSAQTINERLRQAGFDHFAEKSEIANKLGGRELQALGVIMTLDLSLYDYVQDLNNPAMAVLMKMNKPLILEILLQGSPEALEELKGLGLYKPRR